MEDESVVPATSGNTSKPFILFRIWQWVVVAFFALIAIAILSDLGKLDLPGAPVVLYWAAVGAVVGIAVLHSPPAFFRLPMRGKLITYGGIIPAFILFVLGVSGVQGAYEKTPQGAKAAAAYDEAKEREAAVSAIAAKRVADDIAHKQAAETVRTNLEKLNRCYSFFGHHIPAFNDAIKDSLSNPHSFEHVKTEVFEPDPDGYNAEMVFRGENRFSAIITGSVRARINPDTCEMEIKSELNTQ